MTDPRVIRFFVSFIVLQAVLFGLELTPWAQQHLVAPWTNALARISSWLVTVFDPNVMATGSGTVSGSSGRTCTSGRR